MGIASWANRECRISTLLSHSDRGQRRAALVEGFGCRPVVTYPRVMRAGVRKPPREEPSGGGRTASGLWEFDGAAAWVGDRLAGVGGGGWTGTVGSLASQRPDT